MITSLLWKDLKSGRFTFSSFWERRARRIAPALIVVILITLAAGYFILLPFDFLNLGKAATSQAIFGANFYYWLTSGYFAGEASEKPLLHTWSLAVEEQFYLLAPVLLWGLHRLKFTRRPEVICLLVALGFLASFLLGFYMMHGDREAAFYLLPGRAWELLCGSFIAMLPISLLPRRRFLREALSFFGLGMILFAIFTFTKTTPFPGAAALLPCLGTAILIASNTPEGLGYTFPGTILSARPLIFIGLISYSLYLWHWPFLAFAKYLEVAPPSIGSRFILVAAGFVIAVLSWRFVETPFRNGRLAPRTRSMFFSAGAGLAACLLTGVLCIEAHGFPKRFTREQKAMAKARFDSDFLPDLCSFDVIQEKLFPLGASGPTLKPSVFVWGDSHAKAVLPVLEVLFREWGIAGRAALRSSTPPVLGWSPKVAPDPAEVMAYNEATFSYIERHHIHLVILVAKWRSYARTPVSSSSHEIRPFELALLSTTRKLHAIGCRTWLVLDVPYQYFDVPRALSRPLLTRSYINSHCTKVAETDMLDCIDPRIVSQIKEEGTCILDPKPLFLDSTGQFYIVQSGPIVLYCDHDHLTRAGAKKILQPFFGNSFAFGQRPSLHDQTR